MLKPGDVLAEEFGEVTVTSVDVKVLEDGTKVVVVTAGP